MIQNRLFFSEKIGKLRCFEQMFVCVSGGNVVNYTVLLALI